MLSLSFYFAFISIIIVTMCIIIATYCVRLNRAHRHVLPHPMQVYVITQPHRQELHYPQMFWTSPTEQPPPPYSTITQLTDVHCSTTCEMHESHI